MNATLFDQWGGRQSTKFDGTRPHACPEKDGSTRSSWRGAWRAPHEATSLARTCAISKGRMPRSRSHVGGAGRRIWQPLGEPRVEVRMKISNLEIWRAPRAPATGDTVGSCPAEKFARGPKIRAVQCSWGCRRGGAHAGRAVARRGAAHICSRLAAALSRSQRSDAGTRPVSASTQRRRQGSLWWPPVGAHCTLVATRLCVAHGFTWRARAVRGGRATPEEGGARVCRFLRRPREALELLTSTTTEILLLAGVGGRAARIHRAQKSRSGWAARFGCGRSCRAARSSAKRPGT